MPSFLSGVDLGVTKEKNAFFTRHAKVQTLISYGKSCEAYVQHFIERLNPPKQTGFM